MNIFLHSIPQIAENWDKIKHLFKAETISAKTVLLRQGEVSTRIFFIVSGILRLYYVDKDGKDVSFQFFFENQLVSSFESFYLEKESKFYIESLEETKLLSISKTDFESLLKEIPQLQRFVTEFVCDRFFNYTNIFLSQIKSSPEERYLELIKDDPQILERVPHHYIASYLGITPVSLSRIRNRITKNISPINKC